MSGNNSVKEIETEESLPQGWTKQFAPDGRVYFVDHLNKKVGGIVPYDYSKQTSSRRHGWTPAEMVTLQPLLMTIMKC